MVLFREPTQQMLNEFLSRIELATVHSEEEDSEDRGQEDNIKMFEKIAKISPLKHFFNKPLPHY